MGINWVAAGHRNEAGGNIATPEDHRLALARIEVLIRENPKTHCEELRRLALDVEAYETGLLQADDIDLAELDARCGMVDLTPEAYARWLGDLGDEASLLASGPAQGASIMKLNDQARAARFTAIDRVLAVRMAEVSRLAAAGIAIPRSLPARKEGTSFEDYATTVRRIKEAEAPKVEVQPNKARGTTLIGIDTLNLGALAVIAVGLGYLFA